MPITSGLDDDSLSAGADLVANRCLYAQFSSRQQSERYFIADRAGEPLVFGHPRDRRKTHAGAPADDFEDGSDRIDLRDGRDVGGEGGVDVRHDDGRSAQFKVLGRMGHLLV
jgi:hypothetical protein